MIHLETDRLILRDYKESDFDAYFRLKTDDKTMYYLQDVSTRQAFINKMRYVCNG